MDTHLGNELLDILVLDKRGRLVKGGLGGLLNVGLGVPDGSRKNGDELGGGGGHLDGGRDNELLEDLQAAELDLPLAVLSDVLEESGKDNSGTPRVHGLNNSLNSVNGSLLDSLVLVGKGLGEGREDGAGGGRDNVRLEVDAGAVLAKGRDGRSSGLTNGSVLLVAEGL